MSPLLSAVSAMQCHDAEKCIQRSQLVLCCAVVAVTLDSFGQGEHVAAAVLLLRSELYARGVVVCALACDAAVAHAASDAGVAA